MQIELERTNRFLVRRELFKLVTQADQANFDGLKLLFEALKQKYTQSSHTIESQTCKAVQAFACPHCQKPFQTDAALKGHGPNRCKKRQSNV